MSSRPDSHGRDVEDVPNKAEYDVDHVEHDAVRVNTQGPLETKFADLNRTQAFRYFWRAILFCVFACWGALNDGFQGQLPGNVLALPAFVSTMADTEINGRPAIAGLTVSFLSGFPAMAQIFGQLLGGFLSNRIGRKGNMMVFSALFMIGSALSISAQNWQWFTGAGVVTKFGLGIAQTTLIVYLAEVAPFQLRGTGMAAYQLFLAGGQLIGAIATQIQVKVDSEAWRPLMASEFVMTGIFIIMLPFIPESPIFHIRRGNAEKAKRCLSRLYGTAPSYDPDYEYQVIVEQIAAEQALLHQGGKRPSFFEIFQGSNLRRTIAGVVGACSQPLAGAPLLFSYSTYFFTIVGLSDPFLVTVVIDVVLLVVIGISMYACERVGRRLMMLTGCFCMFLFSLGLGVTGSFSSESSDKAALGLLLLWVIAYSWSAAPIGFIAAVALASQSSCFFLFYWTVPLMLSPDAGNLGVQAAYIFAGLVLPVFIIVYFYYPETTGRTYVELDELYNMNIPARKFKSTATSTESRGLKNKSIAHAVVQ